jgi:hypothetical protein
MKKSLSLLAYPFLTLVRLGLVSLLIAHIATLLGVIGPFQTIIKFLVPGLFLVWLPTILFMGRLTREFKQKEIWRAALRGCPKWLQRALWIVFGYAWVGFFALPAIYGGGAGSPINNARSMSAVLLTFFAIAFCVLYSATRAQTFDESRRCANGHRVSPLAKYCDECGAPIPNHSPGPTSTPPT